MLGPPGLEPHAANEPIQILRSGYADAPPVARACGRSGAACSFCADDLWDGAVQADETAGNRHRFVDGRLVCSECAAIFEPEGFVVKFNVCINPLCRRKWKQLATKVLSVFCPPCRRHLEDYVSEARQLSEVALLNAMYAMWVDVASELAEVLGYPLPPRRQLQEPKAGDPIAARRHCNSLLQAFHESFPQPTAADVRNLNSVMGRRKHYRGVVRRRKRTFVCDLEAHTELTPELEPCKTLQQTPKDFKILDWSDELEDGQEMDFIAFPNPSVGERDHVSRVVRLLGESEDAQDSLKAPPPLFVQSQASGTCPETIFSSASLLSGSTREELEPKGTSSASLLAGICEDGEQYISPTSGRACGVGRGKVAADGGREGLSCFADLMQWTEEELVDNLDYCLLVKRCGTSRRLICGRFV
eukprot:TRINITY_DN20452_c0_g1_i1.p1 TRINITY_DN20452_c0_g1~~TRINITY_DN20452_c0_g1_i1.p1  ORF type:complete len:416 (+),score=59.69 TRINITY_DN20452_c0_g1_i1:156-1403(+)